MISDVSEGRIVSLRVAVPNLGVIILQGVKHDFLKGKD